MIKESMQKKLFLIIQISSSDILTDGKDLNFQS